MPVGLGQDEALLVAAKVNAELAEGALPGLQFRPITIEALVSQWLDQHEQVRRSSLATVRSHSALGYRPPAPEAREITPRGAGFARHPIRVQSIAFAADTAV